jgi:hypothetical protein
LFGLSGREAREAAAAGQLRLAGCFVPEEPPNWACGAGHQWRHDSDLRGWDVRLARVLESYGYVDALDLDDLVDEVQARASRWEAAGMVFEIVRWPATDKPAVSVRVETQGSMGELTLWASGEAEMIWSPPPAFGEPMQEHYELTGLTWLRECLYDLEARVRFVDPSP